MGSQTASSPCTKYGALLTLSSTLLSGNDLWLKKHPLLLEHPHSNDIPPSVVVSSTLFLCKADQPKDQRRALEGIQLLSAIRGTKNGKSLSHQHGTFFKLEGLQSVRESVSCSCFTVTVSCALHSFHRLEVLILSSRSKECLFTVAKWSRLGNLFLKGLLLAHFLFRRQNFGSPCGRAAADFEQVQR